MKLNSHLAIDAFCGSGGLSYGLHKAGFKVCYAFDNEKKQLSHTIEIWVLMEN